MNSTFETAPQEAESYRPERDTEDIDLELESSQGELHPGTEQFAPRIKTETEGISIVSDQVSADRQAQWEKAKIKFYESLGVFKTKTEIKLTTIDGVRPVLDSLKMGMGLGQIRANLKLPKYSLFSDMGSGSPTYSLTFSGEEISGELAFVPSIDGARVWKGELGGGPVKFKLSGEQQGDTDILHISSAEIEVKNHLGPGQLRASVEADISRGEREAEIEYQIVF